MEEKDKEICRLMEEIEKTKMIAKQLDQDNTKLIYDNFINEMKILRQGNKNSKLERFKSHDFK
jgi:hypothetical protein